MSAIEARFDGGSCRDCYGPIRVRQLIRSRDDDGRRVWVHEVCPAGALDPRPGTEVCTTCWLEKPCGCDEERSGR